MLPTAWGSATGEGLAPAHDAAVISFTMENARVNCDVIVIGGGPMGLSTAYHLSKRKIKTLVLEQLRSAHPSNFEVMEVYSGITQIPPEFASDACAVIAIWTK